MIRQKEFLTIENLASPYVIDAEALKYIDYDLDIRLDGEKEIARCRE